MFAVPEQLAAANQAAVEAAVSYSQIVFDSAERLLDLNIKVAKSVLADSAKNAKVLAEAKNVQELIALRQSITQPTVEKMIAYSKAVYEVAAETHAELQSFIETHTTGANKNVAALLDKFVKSAPAGSEVLQAAVKSAINAANSAYDTMSQAAKQVAEVTEASVAAASSNALTAKNKSA
jgi:phasin family protein